MLLVLVDLSVPFYVAATASPGGRGCFVVPILQVKELRFEEAK